MKKYQWTDGVMWAARKWGQYPNAYVKCVSNTEIAFVINRNQHEPSTAFVIQRKLAKLLAKRILQCLEET